MSTIIAGRFDQQALAEQARDEILRAGFSEERITTFYVNQPGQHDLYRIGGDEEQSAGAEHSERGLARGGIAGGVTGAAIGALTMPIFGPIGPIAGAFVGAHLGDLAGSLNEMEDDGQKNDDSGPRYRHAGMMLAVRADTAEDEVRAITVLRSLHAQDIERAQGTIANGDWEDFDPLAPPALIEHKAH